MNEDGNSPGRISLQPIVATTAVVIGMVAIAVTAYLLLDILLLFFLGIVVAAALRPGHVVLCRWGVPDGLAVLLIYFSLFLGLALIAIIVGPVVLEQLGTFVAEAPGTYDRVRAYLQASVSLPLHLLGQRLPTFERLTQGLTGLAPQFYLGTLSITTSIVTLPAYFITVLAIGFYWTIEVPRFERLFLSLLAVERRPRALNAWHEIESNLGGFMRGQGLAMLSIGAASAVGYALIGLPNVLALAVLAGLLEAVPFIGPLLAVSPAILVALPMGLHTVFLVMGFAALLQLVENNVLIPRIMHRTVGISALVSLLAVLAFGTLYGILGVFIAIPMAAVIQVLLNTMVINVEPVVEPSGLVDNPWEDLRARVRALRQQARVRLRARATRMGIDTATPDHVDDAVDEQIEVAVARVENLIALAEETAEPLADAAKAAIVEKLQDTTQQLEQAHDPTAGHGAAAERTPDSNQTTQPAAIVDSLDQATQRFKDAVQDAETLVVAAQEEAREGNFPAKPIERT